VATTVLCHGQEDVLEKRLAVDVAGRPLLGLDAGDGAVLIVGLGGVLHFGNNHDCSNESQWTKVQDQRECLVEHGLRRHLAKQVGRVGKVIGGACSWSLAVPGQCVARNRHAVQVNDGLECATIRDGRRQNAEARRDRRLGRWLVMSHRILWKTPRGRYDEHISKFSLSMKLKFN
jgi:hypothetical protein